MLRLFSLIFLICSTSFGAVADSLPIRHTSLLKYVQEAPDQGESGTCLYVAATGAVELLANKKAGIQKPIPYGEFDLAESFVMYAPRYRTRSRLYFWEETVLRFNVGYGVHVEEWPFEPWDDTVPDSDVWDYMNWRNMPKVEVPSVATIRLFVKGKNRWSTGVLRWSDIEKIKEALVKYDSPIMVNYNDYGYWHTILIVGYDDELPGSCYDLSESDCGERKGSFYVRDSFGRKVEVRDYDWFYIKGNAAFVVKEK